MEELINSYHSELEENEYIEIYTNDWNFIIGPEDTLDYHDDMLIIDYAKYEFGTKTVIVSVPKIIHIQVMKNRE